MSRFIIGVAVGIAGAVMLVGAGRRVRMAEDDQHRLELARWDDECGAPSPDPHARPGGAPRVEGLESAAR